MSEHTQLSPDQVDVQAVQAARYQDVNEAHGIPHESEWNLPTMLRGAFGDTNTRLIIQRMVEIRKYPEERQKAESIEREFDERFRQRKAQQ